MPTCRHRILLIPTSDSVITNWIPAYQPLLNAGHEVLMIHDSPWVGSDFKSPFGKVDLNLSRQIQEAGPGLKRTLLQTRLVRAANRILTEHQIDAVIVSNDNHSISNTFVNCARARGIATVLHQANGLFYTRDDPTDPDKDKAAPPWWMQTFLHFTIDGRLAKHVDECWLQGPAWEPYMYNHRVHNVGNPYYQQLKAETDAVTAKDKEAFLESHQLDNAKPTVTFYSQPFGDMGLLNSETLPVFYDAIDELARNLGPGFNTIFKSHPRETEHRQYLNPQHLCIIERCDLTQLVATSQFAVSVFSAMAIQSRIAGVTTLGYHPSILTPKCAQAMIEAFHDTFDNIQDLTQAILNPRETESSLSEFQNKFDMSLDTPSLILGHLDRLTK